MELEILPFGEGALSAATSRHRRGVFAHFLSRSYSSWPARGGTLETAFLPTWGSLAGLGEAPGHVALCHRALCDMLGIADGMGRARVSKGLYDTSGHSY